MKSILKFEFKRTFSSKKIRIIVMIGIIIALANIAIYDLPRYSMNKACNMNTPLALWMGLDGNYINMIWITLMPLIAFIPYGESYFEDKSSGFTNIIYTKTDKNKYINSKFIVNFIIGGISYLVPLFLNLYILMMMYPSIYPNLATDSLAFSNIFPNIYLNNTYLYIGIYMIIQFLFAGAFATFGLAVSTVSKNKFIPLVAPFALLILNIFLGEFIFGTNTMITGIIQAHPAVTNVKLSYIIIEFLLLFFVSAIFYYIGANKNEKFR